MNAIFLTRNRNQRPLVLLPALSRTQRLRNPLAESRTKKPQPSRGASEQDKRQFQNSRDYMVRIDDMLACRSCRNASTYPVRSQWCLFSGTDFSL